MEKKKDKKLLFKLAFFGDFPFACLRVDKKKERKRRKNWEMKNKNKKVMNFNLLSQDIKALFPVENRKRGIFFIKEFSDCSTFPE